MIHLLKSLFGDTPREQPVKRTAATARLKPSHAGSDYRAVSLAQSTGCHAVASGFAGKRYLLREAPSLPLTDCANPAKCSCKFRKHADRRDGDRRLLGMAETNRWFAGSERRQRAGRRATKN
jgi:hypothetical protein